MGIAVQETFQARKSTHPDGRVILIVTGEVEFASSGYEATLQEVVPQGFNFTILDLEVIETPPNGQAPSLPTRVSVQFEKELTLPCYTVNIRGAGPQFTIPAEWSLADQISRLAIKDDLGPGCCVLQGNGFILSVRNVGTRAFCDDLARRANAQVVSYTPGQDYPCPPRSADI